jgi:hypothetical protein
MRSLEEDHALHVRRGGHDIEGRWHVAGDEVQVECAYGTDRARFDGAPPTRVAEFLIARLAFAALSSKGDSSSLEPLMG